MWKTLFHPAPKSERDGQEAFERRLEAVENACKRVQAEWLDYENRFLKIMGRLNAREKKKIDEDALRSTNADDNGQPHPPVFESPGDILRRMRDRR